MIPKPIVAYLHHSGSTFRRRPHPRAVTAQELAASVHVAGARVAKSVLVEADGRWYIAVLPATEMLDRRLFARAIGAGDVRLLDEREFGPLFAGCETGAEPPFGGLFGLPVILDEAFDEAEPILFRAGSHEEAVEMRCSEFVHLEHPERAAIGVPMHRGAVIA